VNKVAAKWTRGVGGRLFIALSLNALVAFAIGLGAFNAFGILHAGITEVTSRLFPTVVASAKLERQHQRIMRTIESLALVTDNLEQETIDQGLADQLDGYDLLLQELDTVGGRAVAQRRLLNDQRDEILRVRDKIDRLVTVRIEAGQALQERARDLRRLSDTLAEARWKAGGPALQDWRDTVLRLLFLAASVQGIENVHALASAQEAASRGVAQSQAAFKGLVGAARGAAKEYQSACEDIVGGERSVFQARQTQLVATQNITGLLNHANEVSLLNTGLNTGAFTEQISLAEERRREIIRSTEIYSRLFFVSIGIVIGGLALTLFFVQRRVVTRLTDVCQAIRDKIEGRDVEIPVKGQDEISELASALRFFIHETEEKSEKLRENEHWLRAVLDGSPSPLMISGRDDGNIRFINGRAAAMFGVDDRERAIGRPAGDFWVNPDARLTFADAVVAAGGLWDFEAALTTDQGQRFWGLLSGTFFQYQGEDVLLISQVDITARKQAEEALRRTQAFLDAVIENVPNVLYVVEGRTGQVVLWNRAAEQAFARSHEQVVGRRLLDTLGQSLGGLLQHADDAAFSGGGPLSSEEIIPAVDGSVKTFAFHRHRFEWSEEGNDHLICIAIDISAAKKAAEDLRVAKEQAERADAAKTEFLATMSHEMRTPLNGILGLGRLLLADRLSRTQRRHADSIMHCGRTLLRQLNDILDLRKIEDGRLELDLAPWAVQNLLDDVRVMVASLAAEKRIALEITVAQDVPATIICDQQRLRQILLNLLSNAVKFTDVGAVRVHVAVEGVAGAESLVVRVADTGIGIPADRQEAIFNKLEQADQTISRRYGGTGLGLAIVRNLLTAMNGSISVDSTEGLGSTFTFRVPLVRCADLPEPAVAPVSLPVALGPLSLLLVEDQLINREVAIGLFDGRDHRLVIAETGQEALHLAATDRFDAILLDIRLPDIDGVEVARRIRAFPDRRRAGVPIIALTADVFAGAHARYLEAGMDAVIEKPLDPDRLFQLLADVTERRARPPTMERPAGPPVPSGLSEDPSASPARPVLDGAVLGRYRSDLGEARFQRILQILYDTVEADLPRLATADGPMDQLADVAHRLAGACSHFGFDDFVFRMRSIERLLRDGRRVEASPLMGAAPQAFQEAREALARWSGVGTA
jgi:PAS domain S-box-containing protein